MEMSENEINEIINSEPFIRWFGDWKHNPDSASKVVDKNGLPLVVHHGSPKFIGKTFSQDKTGQSINHGERGLFYTTSDINWARRFSYPASEGSSVFSIKADKTKPGVILSGFLKIINPLNLFQVTQADIDNMWEMTKDTRMSRGFKNYGNKGDYDKWLSDINMMLRYQNHQGVKFEICNRLGNFGETLKRYGYDGIIANMDNNDRNNPIEYGFIYPEQFKYITDFNQELNNYLKENKTMIKITRQDLKCLISEAVEQFLKEKSSPRTKWFVSDDGGVYNVFSFEDFDENGRYLTNPEYNLKDFDIIKVFNDMEQAFKYADDMNDNI